MSELGFEPTWPDCKAYDVILANMFYCISEKMEISLKIKEGYLDEMIFHS